MVRVGIGFTPFGVRLGDSLIERDADSLRAVLARITDAGIDHVVLGDHVSFHGGHGDDGLVEAALLLGAHPALRVHVAVYLLALRHPVLVARQLASIAKLAPGRLHFGVGIGGEDRHEVEITGVDPATRGRRTDEALAALRRLLTGAPVDLAGEFFTFTGAQILPRPDPPIPVVVGGRSDAALRRAGRDADGWLGIWVSPERFAGAVATVEAEAAAAGRGDVAWDHGLLAWCGFGDSREEAERYLAPAISSVYATPFDRFRRYAPMGGPDDVAAALAPYVAAGAGHFDLVAVGPGPDEAIEAVAEVRKHLGATDDRPTAEPEAGSAP